MLRKDTLQFGYTLALSMKQMMYTIAGNQTIEYIYQL